MNHFLKSQPLLLPALACTFGILIASFSSTSTWWLLLCIAICIFLAHRVSKPTFWLTLTLSICGYWIHSHSLSILHKQRAKHGNLVTALGIIEQAPRAVRDFRQETPIRISQSNDPSLTGARVLLNIPADGAPLVGEKIWISGKLSTPRHRMNPDVLDKEKLMLHKGMALELYANQTKQTGKIAQTHCVHAWAERSRRWIRSQLTKGVDNEDSAKIILAMFLGEKPHNGSEILNSFKHSGTIHVFAVSGLHVMMIGLLFTLFLRLCRTPLHLWVPLVICIMFFYAIITGMNPPAMRAAIMGSTVLVALLLPRKPSLPNSLWLSAIIAMLWSTHCIFLPGFQLSYAVLISICITGSWWAHRWKWMTKVDPFFPKSLFTKWQQFLYQLRYKSASTLSVSSSAWVGSSFLIWLYFGLITPIAIIASLPIMLMVFALLTICCLTLTIGSISDNIASPLNSINSRLASATHSTTQFFSSLSLLRYHRKPWSEEERVIVYSIPNGGAAHYIGIGGGVMLDAASTDSFYREVWPSLRRNSAPIDSLIASHADVNHIQGLQEIIKKFEIKQLVIAGSNKRSPAHRTLIELAQQKGIKIITPANQTLSLSHDAWIEIIDLDSSSYPLADDRCAVYLLHWNSKKILFMNDVGGLSEQRIIRNHPHLTADVVILGKHSKDQSISIDFIKSLNPSHVIASETLFPDGEFRSSQWKKSILESSIHLLLLENTGAITITKKGANLEIKTVYPIQ